MTTVRLRDLRVQIAVLAVIATTFSFIFHIRAAFSLPPPWPDEAVFGWQVIAFAERTSLFAPEINPDRALFWMPPGYFVLLGMVFKLVPFSLVGARFISWLLLTVGLVALVDIHADSRAPRTSAAMILLLSFAPAAVAAGNVARMESLVIACTAVGFAVIRRGHGWSGVSLLTFGPLVHPNGVYFAAAGLVAAVAHRALGRPMRANPLVMGSAILAWLIFGSYIVGHWSNFVEDWRFQFARKGLSQQFVALFQTRWWVPLSLYGVAFVTQLLRRRPVVGLLWGVAAQTVMPIGNEIWYEVFDSFAFVILLVVALDVAADAMVAYRKSRVWAALVSTVALTVTIGGGCELGVFYSVRDKLVPMEWGCQFGLSGPGRYWQPVDEAAVKPAITALALETPNRRVAFFPAADSLLLRPNAQGEYTPFFPVFSEVRPDLAVFHRSAYENPCERTQMDATMDAWGVKPSHLVHERGSERWYVRRAHD